MVRSESLCHKKDPISFESVYVIIFFYQSGGLKTPGPPGLNRVGIHSCLNSFEIYTLREENHRFIYTITFSVIVLMARGFANCVYIAQRPPLDHVGLFWVVVVDMWWHGRLAFFQED